MDKNTIKKSILKDMKKMKWSCFILLTDKGEIGLYKSPKYSNVYLSPKRLTTKGA